MKRANKTKTPVYHHTQQSVSLGFFDRNRFLVVVLCVVVIVAAFWFIVG